MPNPRADSLRGDASWAQGQKNRSMGSKGAIDPGEASEARAHQKIARRGSRGYPVQEDKCIKSRSAVTTIRLAERTRAGA